MATLLYGPAWGDAMRELDDCVAENERLRAENEQRAAELAVIRSVQHALAAELDMQGIYDAAGDKLREIFHDADLNIRVFDPEARTVVVPYVYEEGQRLTSDLSAPLSGMAAHIFRTATTLLINENLQEEAAKLGAPGIPGTSSEEKSAIYVPLVW